MTLCELSALAVEGRDLPARYRASLTGIAGHLGARQRFIGLHLLYGAELPLVQAANRRFF